MPESSLKMEKKYVKRLSKLKRVLHLDVAARQLQSTFLVMYNRRR